MAGETGGIPKTDREWRAYRKAAGQKTTSTAQSKARLRAVWDEMDGNKISKRRRQVIRRLVKGTGGRMGP